MCLTAPGRVVSVDGAVAIVDLDGRERRVSTLVLPGIRPGDWVLVTAGTIVERVEPPVAAAMADAARLARTDG